MKKRNIWHVMLEGGPLQVDAEERRSVRYRRGVGKIVPRAELDLELEADDLAEASALALSIAAGVEQRQTTAPEPWRVVMAEHGREVWTKD